MKPFACAVVLFALCAQTEPAPPPRVPVLVELFTSEGCSSCPAADAHLAMLQRQQPVAGAEVIPIALHVDYFDRAGWKDRFSSAAFSNRQTDYARVFGSESVYTPQIVVNGREAIVGTETQHIDSAVAAAAKRAPMPLELVAREAGDRVQLRIAVPAATKGIEQIAIVAAITQDGLSSEVTRGENGGRTLHHVAVARILAQIDVLGPGARVIEHTFRIDRAWGSTGLKAVAWLQGRKSRHVFAAAVDPILD